MAASETAPDPTGRPRLQRGQDPSITREQDVRDALREAEERFRQLAENIGAVFWLYDYGEARPIYLSPAFETVWGRTTEELLSEPGLWTESVHPDDRNRQLTTTPETRHVQYEVEYRIVRPDGSVRWIRDRGFPVFDSAGKVCRTAGIAEDITEQKESEDTLRASEERFRLMVEGSEQVFFYEHDPEGRFLYLSPSVGAVLGYSPEELLGRNYSVLLATNTADSEVHRRTRAALAEDQIEPYTALLRRRDGGTVMVELVERRIRSGHEVMGVQGFARDVTRRVEADRKLHESEERLRQAQKMEAVGRLAGGIAHDFNNVLTVIRGHLELGLDASAPGSPVRADIEDAARAAERASELTRQLLAYSRQQVLRPRVLAVNGVVEEMERMLRRLIGETVRLVPSLEPSVGHVYADPAQLQQVLMNLVVNAVDAMPQGGSIAIRTRSDTVAAGEDLGTPVAMNPGRYAVLTVTDTGEGMDGETLGRVFEPFFTTKAAGKGTGLGLSTVYGIVKQSGGYIWARSQPGAGAEFEVWLPHMDAPPEAAPQTGAGATTAADSHASASATILVVEDDRAVRKLVLKTLRSRGYSLLEAENGRAALNLLASHTGPVDLVLTDVVMPEMGGPELGRAIRSTTPGMRVLYMSGYTEDELLLERGGTLRSDIGLLEKPFTPAVLLQTVDGALRSAAPA